MKSGTGRLRTLKMNDHMILERNQTKRILIELDQSYFFSLSVLVGISVFIRVMFSNCNEFKLERTLDKGYSNGPDS